MLGLLLVLLGIAAVCARLGVWQLDRAQQAARQADDAAAAAVAPVPLPDVLAPQATFTGAADRRLVTAQGRFGPDEVLVPGREVAGDVGLLVVTPFVVADSGATLAVVRGWVPDASAAAAAPAPGGDVTLEGLLRMGEAGGDGDVGDGQVSAVSPAELVNRWGGPLYTGYLQLTERSAADAGGLRPVPPPEPGSGAWDLQNLAYALQWWLFGGFAVLLWARLVRDEARRDVTDAEGPGRAGAGPEAGPDGPPLTPAAGAAGADATT